MTEPSSESFYVSVAAEAGEADLVADIVFQGRQVAAVRLSNDVWTIIVYDLSGAEALALPFDGLRAALQEAAERLSQERL